MNTRYLVALLAFGLCARAGICQTGKQLTLSKAVDIALGSHPALKAAEAQIRGAEGLRQQAGLRPNPEVSFQSENWRLSGVPPFSPAQELDVFGFASQTLETGAKRARRVAVAQWDLKIASLERQALQWKIRQDVRRAFLRALLAQKQLAILKESGRYFEQIVEYNRVRVEQGVTAESDLIKVRLERERLSLAENTSAVEADRARVELLRTMGATDYDAAFQIVDEAPVRESGPSMDLNALLALARENRFDVLAAQAQVERARSQVDAQKSLASPDWTVMLGYKRTTGYNTLLAGVSVPLPIFNRNKGNIVHSTNEVSRTEFMLSSAVSQLNAEIAAALAAIRRNRAMLGQMAKTMLERAEESWRISFSAYQEGGADLLRVVDAQRVRNEVQQLYTRTEMEYRLSLADLEYAVGEENLHLAEELLRVQP